MEDTQSSLRFYTLVASKGETVWERPIGRENNDQPMTPLTEGGWFYPLGERRSDAIWLRDRSGIPVLVLWTDSMGNGGMGGIYVYAYAFQDGIVPLPVPDYGMEAELDQYFDWNPKFWELFDSSFA